MPARALWFPALVPDFRDPFRTLATGVVPRRAVRDPSDLPGGIAVLDRAEPQRSQDDEGPGGIFPSWRWLYATVAVYAVLLIAVLHLISAALDHSVP
jgi:hypothetical protein